MVAPFMHCFVPPPRQSRAGGWTPTTPANRPLSLMIQKLPSLDSRFFRLEYLPMSPVSRLVIIIIFIIIIIIIIMWSKWRHKSLYQLHRQMRAIHLLLELHLHDCAKCFQPLNTKRFVLMISEIQNSWVMKAWMHKLSPKLSRISSSHGLMETGQWSHYYNYSPFININLQRGFWSTVWLGKKWSAIEAVCRPI